MAAAKPLSFKTIPTSSDAVDVEGLRELFSAPLDGEDVEKEETAGQQAGFTPASEEPEEPADEIAQAEARDLGDSSEQAKTMAENVFLHNAADAGTAVAETNAQTNKVSRADLVNVLEGFVNLIKNSGDLNPAELQKRPMSFEPPPQPTRITAVTVDDKTAEVEELRCLLVEAQETIIRLLTERVEDRARISSMETELRLLPDLQLQADRAMAAAINTEDFRRDLTKVKFELERVRLSRVRSELQKNGRTSLWAGVRGWLFKQKEALLFAAVESRPTQAPESQGSQTNLQISEDRAQTPDGQLIPTVPVEVDAANA